MTKKIGNNGTGLNAWLGLDGSSIGDFVQPASKIERPNTYEGKGNRYPPSIGLQVLEDGEWKPVNDVPRLVYNSTNSIDVRA